jgi:hypothetical protein
MYILQNAVVNIAAQNRNKPSDLAVSYYTLCCKRQTNVGAILFYDSYFRGAYELGAYAERGR